MTTYTNTSEKWGDAVSGLTVDDYKGQADIFGLNSDLITADGEHVYYNKEAIADADKPASRPYTIRTGKDTLTVISRETGATLAEYRLDASNPRKQARSLRDAINRHLASSGATLNNYQW